MARASQVLRVAHATKRAHFWKKDGVSFDLELKQWLFLSSSPRSSGKPLWGAVSKGLAAKGSAVGAKAATGHRGHHALARKVVGKIVNKATDEAVDSALSKADAVMSNRTKNKQDR